MARKNLLKGLMDGATPDGAVSKDSPKTETKQPRRASTGAIGAVSRSIEALKSRSVVDIDPDDIKAGGVNDRLEHDEDDHQKLMHSLSTYGQQVPILVRPDPEEPDKYQIVYGRRRVLAMRDLGLPIKAMIRDLDDDALIMAQGQENSARRELSFIERVNFARQMLDAGYERKIIADALSTDKTLISRMVSVAETVPIEVIEMIGAAPSTGRDRWLTFARLWDQSDYSIEDASAAIAVAPKGETSDERFAALLAALESHSGDTQNPATARKTKIRPAPLIGDNDVSLGRIKRQPNATVLEFDRKRAAGFDLWLADHIHEIHRDWLNSQSDE